ncbi:putative membrane protein [Terriglobus roseus DSM 18391]|uniref:Protein-methionine-sulfoxide reductase heme-binding subunit MsrQ n=1 Tax=Terriglobus roseus (strain DSM 18391 / NRRL B-41598 / KBS 63) TaxID=926566 RepID=I3ZHJ1_TERRK|nr:protein-methionine-sulfoxide reductase heme-binding subunit MsrQ [Terriglobus roseus]AFL88367.1 putative membrane protein [Terriglobus roseus DSM 18391]AFL88709.1 putative membrane protein [Terriglobus roseus DSM 18391]
MSNRTIKILKPFVFLLALVPFFGIVWSFHEDTLGADPVQTITHWTGDWALWMLLISLAITPVRRLSPKLAWLVRLRRMLGLFAFFYASLHLLTYVLLFSGFDLPGALDALRQGQFHVLREDWIAVWPTMVEDVAKRRFIQVGLLSYVILLALALTSPQWIMRKMGGKPWQTLHRTVYIAAVFGVIHYWWLVKKGVLSPWKDSAVLLVLLLARPAYQWLKKKPAVRVAA